MFEISVQVRFDAGHRLLGYAGKCLSPHGHGYTAEIALAGPALDELGMLVDFSAVKRAVKGWISAHWDHAFLVNDADKELVTALGGVADARVFLLPGCNPTAENLAQILCERLRDEVGLAVHKVTIWETAEQSAVFTAPTHLPPDRPGGSIP
jgi:6-pyruvoyltetrahydropterin/6-carboxytetrahydropterin synthase